MVLFRQLLGDVLRSRRMHRGLTLREVSAEARVSLGYISEIERGQKEASSELLASLCGALDVPLSAVLREVSDAVAEREAELAPVAVEATPLQVAKPAGTVFVAVASPRGTSARELRLEGDREAVRRAACRRALDALGEVLTREVPGLG